MMDSWSLIETAPKGLVKPDTFSVGPVLMLWIGDPAVKAPLDNRLEIGRWMVSQKFDYAGWADRSGRPLYGVTHWKPVIAGPMVISTGSGAIN